MDSDDNGPMPLTISGSGSPASLSTLKYPGYDERCWIPHRGDPDSTASEFSLHVLLIPISKLSAFREEKLFIDLNAIKLAKNWLMQLSVFFFKFQHHERRVQQKCLDPSFPVQLNEIQKMYLLFNHCVACFSRIPPYSVASSSS